jgi:hypothetical protein
MLSEKKMKYKLSEGLVTLKIIAIEKFISEGHIKYFVRVLQSH